MPVKKKKKSKPVASQGDDGSQGRRVPQAPEIKASDLYVIPQDYLETRHFEMHAAYVKDKKDHYTEEISRLENEHTKYVEF